MVIIFLWGQQLRAQTAVIGIIDFYGLEKVSASDIRHALKVKVNDSLDLDNFHKKDKLPLLLAVPGVKRADLGLVCCTGMERNWILYVGISEKDTDYFSYNILSVDSSHLPAQILETSRKFDAAFTEAILKGDNGEDDSQGHMLSNNQAARAYQEKYIGYASSGLDLLRNVSRHSADGEQRAIAVQAIAYAKNKKEIVDDLLYAVHDPDQDVRNNATRALWLIAGYAIQNPGLGILIPGEDFLEMFNSLVWTDQNKASLILRLLTQHRDTLLLQHLKTKALPALVDMARWQSPGHAVNAYFILGRLAGYNDETISSQFGSDNRNIFLLEMLQKINKN